MAKNEKKDPNQPADHTPTGKQKSSEPQSKGTGPGAPRDKVPSTIASGRKIEVAAPNGGDDAQHVLVDGVTRMSLENAPPPLLANDRAAVLNAQILHCTSGLRFVNYEKYIERVFCEGELREKVFAPGLRKAAEAPQDFRAFSALYAYDLLKAATEAYLALQCRSRDLTNMTPEEEQEYQETVLGRDPRNDKKAIANALTAYLGTPRTIPYIDRVAAALVDQAEDELVSLCDVSPLSRFQPCCIELIWSYWHEEGMLVQAINAISLRFQNKRAGTGREPLAHLELEPLRPLNNLLWGYIQDEQHRLTIARRAGEYSHEYGLTLYGKAVPSLNPADVRSKFIEAFHNLLHITSTYYRDQSNRFVVPDAFPLLNALKEVHLILAEGAHNQFGDLPWTARVEMLIQKWLLSRPEMERFLGGRFMVPYPERWMGIVDTMKTLQGWTDVSVRNFRDLAVRGEQLLLSIRYGDWSEISSTLSGENWATIWRDAIQGYIHDYRAVTGVDLAAASSSVRLTAESYMQPSVLLRNRLVAQRRP